MLCRVGLHCDWQHIMSRKVVMDMCAIAGVIGLDVTEEILRKMLQTMVRRGPDGQGICQRDDWAMLHTRLAIIDPAGGAQPMELVWAGECYRISYNGELYNTDELRRELQFLGHTFKGHSDTEVVLHAYIQWGAESVERMNGIFAFGVWEERGKRLFLARDRIGVKPLFYARTPDGLIFASEIKTILAHPAIKPRLDQEGAAQILLLGPGRIPGSGVFRGIQELEPGCRAYYSGGKLSIDQYWKLQDRIHDDSFEETAEKVRSLVTDSIHRQTVSDVPLGCFLSGGLDSSIISAVCAEKIPEIDTFSVDYLGNDQYFVPGKFQPNADSEYIALMTRTIGSRHHWSILQPKELAEALDDATMARDLPGMGDVDFSLLLFCGEIRNQVKVALSGECADEIFGGYPWYRDPNVRNGDGFPWAQNTAQRLLLANPELGLNGDFVEDQYRATLARCDILPENDPVEKRMKEMVNLNFRWFMQTLLDRKDRMSMYHGLEVRVPFCDYRIAEYLYAVPWSFKDYQGREKGLLRYAMRGILPEKVLYRKKSPYPKTYHPEYTRLMRSRLEALFDHDAPLFWLISKQNLRRYLMQEQVWPWYGQLMTLPQTMAYFLQVNFWLEKFEIDVC